MARSPIPAPSASSDRPKPGSGTGKTSLSREYRPVESVDALVSSVVIAGIASVAALGAASVIGVVVNRQSGVLRGPKAPLAGTQDNSDLGLSEAGPTLVHFSADWCGPCAAVRRGVDQVCAALPDLAHVKPVLPATP